MPTEDVTETIINQMITTKNNREFIDKIDSFLYKFKD